MGPGKPATLIEDESMAIPLSLFKIGIATEGVETVTASSTAYTKQTGESPTRFLLSSLPKNHVLMVITSP